MRWLGLLGMGFLAGVAILGCDGDAQAVKEAVAKGTSCPPDRVQVKDVTRQYGMKVTMGFAIYQANVCGGGWQTYCLQRGVNVVTAGEENCLE